MNLAVGIDLGTTNSVAAVQTDGKIQFTRADDGSHTHASVVAFPPGGNVLVGPMARAQRAIDPIHTVYSAKRLIGQNVRSPLVQLALTAMPYEVEEGANQQPLIVMHGRRHTVPEISAEVLRYLKLKTEEQFGHSVEEAVITVPANFSDAQRQATREAGRLAGLDVLRLINEPSAAAVAYGYVKSIDEIVAIFDFGGGTFDISILRIRRSIFEVLGTDGDFFLGGDDIDRALAEQLAAEMNTSLSVDPRHSDEAMTRLMMAAEQIKIHLSSTTSASGTIDSLLVGDTEYSLPFSITRDHFEHLITGHVDRTIEVCRNLMASVDLQLRDISALICVGGSTRIPLVRRRIAEVFGQEPRIDINPDEVVAYGAAVQAQTLCSNPEPVAPPPQLDSKPEAAPAATPAALALAEPVARPLLLDVTPEAMSVGTAGGYIKTILEKNVPIPIEHSKIFTTAHHDQTRVVIECCRGAEKRFADNEPLGTLILEDLPAAPRGQVKIEVTFRVDTDGILHVRAKDQKTGVNTEAQLNVIGAPVEGP